MRPGSLRRSGHRRNRRPTTVQIFQRDENGAKTPNTTMRLQVASWRPERVDAASNLIEQVTRDALLERQGGFAFINRVDGRPIELIRLDP